MGRHFLSLQKTLVSSKSRPPLEHGELAQSARPLGVLHLPLHGVDDLYVGVAAGPVDAVVGPLARVADLLARHQVELGRVEPEPGRQLLQRVLDAAGEGAVHVGRVEQGAEHHTDTLVKYRLLLRRYRYNHSDLWR